MNVWVCIGGGKSLTEADVQFCRLNGWNLATCNMGYKIAPDCHLFHAMDSGWWDQYGDEAKSALSESCEVWSGSYEHAKKHNAHLLTWDGQQGYSDSYGHCHGGKLSGIQLINIVGWKNPDLVILLGYDNLPGHWHGDYPSHMVNGGVVDQSLGDHAKIWLSSPFEIVNCSRETNIPIATVLLEEVPEAIRRFEAHATPHSSILVDSSGHPLS